MAYDQPLVETYRWLANGSLATAADIGYIIGPKGMTGKILNLSVVTTTATTDAASNVLLGTAADTNAIFTLNVPVTAIKLGVSADRDDIAEAPLLTKDTPYLLSGDGAATAGAGDITLTIGWF